MTIVYGCLNTLTIAVVFKPLGVFVYMCGGGGGGGRGWEGGREEDLNI